MLELKQIRVYKLSIGKLLL